VIGLKPSWQKGENARRTTPGEVDVVRKRAKREKPTAVEKKGVGRPQMGGTQRGRRGEILLLIGPKKRDKVVPDHHPDIPL